MIILLPLLVAIAGVLLYALASNPKLAEIGRLLFAIGAAISVYLMAGHSVRLFGP